MSEATPVAYHFLWSKALMLDGTEENIDLGTGGKLVRITVGGAGDAFVSLEWASSGSVTAVSDPVASSVETPAAITEKAGTPPFLTPRLGDTLRGVASSGPVPILVQGVELRSARR